MCVHYCKSLRPRERTRVIIYIMTKNLIPNPTRVQIFENQVFGRVRTLVNEQGEPLFCLKDVCAALALDGRQVVRRLDDGVVSKHLILDILGRRQMASFVNEDGLYDVILDSLHFAVRPSGNRRKIKLIQT